MCHTTLPRYYTKETLGKCFFATSSSYILQLFTTFISLALKRNLDPNPLRVFLLYSFKKTLKRWYRGCVKRGHTNSFQNKISLTTNIFIELTCFDSSKIRLIKNSYKDKNIILKWRFYVGKFNSLLQAIFFASISFFVLREQGKVEGKFEGKVKIRYESSVKICYIQNGVIKIKSTTLSYWHLFLPLNFLKIFFSSPSRINK